MSIVYYIPTDDALLVSAMAGRGKARVVARGVDQLCGYGAKRVL